MAKRPAPPVTRGIMSDQKVWELKMSKAFWEGFKNGFLQASKYGIPIAVALIVGLTLGSWSHPYEVCTRLHSTPEEIAECTWIKMNP